MTGHSFLAEPIECSYKVAQSTFLTAFKKCTNCEFRGERKLGQKKSKRQNVPTFMSNYKLAQKHIHRCIFLLCRRGVELHKMLWLQGQTISAGTKSAACRHLAHMGRLSRQLNQHRGISRSGRGNVRDADGSDAPPLPRAPRRHLRAELTSGPLIRTSVCGAFFFFCTSALTLERLWAFFAPIISHSWSATCVQIQAWHLRVSLGDVVCR